MLLAITDQVWRLHPQSPPITTVQTDSDQGPVWLGQTTCSRDTYLSSWSRLRLTVGLLQAMTRTGSITLLASISCETIPCSPRPIPPAPCVLGAPPFSSGSPTTWKKGTHKSGPLSWRMSNSSCWSIFFWDFFYQVSAKIFDECSLIGPY